LATLVVQVADAAIREVAAPITFIHALTRVDPGEAVKSWLVEEISRMEGSFYKLGPLYPKMFIVMMLGGIAQYWVGSGESA
jgi:hypothetical protein